RPRSDSRSIFSRCGRTLPSGFFLPEFNVISPGGEYAESLNEESQEAGPAQAVDSDADLEVIREAFSAGAEGRCQAVIFFV
ncbi:hypothetical protein, partial [Paenibacillus residui]